MNDARAAGRCGMCGAGRRPPGVVDCGVGGRALFRSWLHEGGRAWYLTTEVDVDNRTVIESKVEIGFCPECGRRLGGGNE